MSEFMLGDRVLAGVNKEHAGLIIHVYDRGYLSASFIGAESREPRDGQFYEVEFLGGGQATCGDADLSKDPDPVRTDFALTGAFYLTPRSVQAIKAAISNELNRTSSSLLIDYKDDLNDAFVTIKSQEGDWEIL